MCILTATGAVVFAVLLWVAFKSTVETMLPELGEPGVPEVVLRAKFKVVLIKPLHISRLELDGNATGRFPNIAICYIIPVRPSITAKKHKEKTSRKVQQTPRPCVSSSVLVRTPAPLFHNQNKVCIVSSQYDVESFDCSQTLLLIMLHGIFREHN